MVGSVAPTAPSAPRGHTTHARVQPRHISGPGGGGAPGPGRRHARRRACPAPFISQSLINPSFSAAPRGGASDLTSATPPRSPRAGSMWGGAGGPHAPGHSQDHMPKFILFVLLFVLFCFSR